MRALFDVNVLIALMDSAHIFHTKAMTWLEKNIDGGWASCPLTQNGCIRILSQPNYPNSHALPDIATRLTEAINSPQHEFWPDSVSLLDETRINWQHLLGPKQITDTYLLALAVNNKGAFVTFDHAVSLNAVERATAKHLVFI